MHPSPPVTSPERIQLPTDYPSSPAQPATQHDDDAHHSLPSSVDHGVDTRKGRGKDRRPNRLDLATPRKAWDFGGASGVSLDESDEDEAGDDDEGLAGSSQLARSGSYVLLAHASLDFSAQSHRY